MPSFYVDDIDIEPHEYVSICRKTEIKELISELIDAGHLPQSVRVLLTRDENQKGFHASEDIFENALDKLHGNYHRMTSEEEETILKIANRL